MAPATVSREAKAEMRSMLGEKERKKKERSQNECEGLRARSDQHSLTQGPGWGCLHICIASQPTNMTRPILANDVPHPTSCLFAHRVTFRFTVEYS